MNQLLVCGQVLPSGLFWFCDQCYKCNPERYPPPPSCPRCQGLTDAAQEGVYGPGDPPTGCQGDPDYGQDMRDKLHAAIMENEDRVNAPEPLGEPSNIRTELARLESDLMTALRLVEKLTLAAQMHNLVLAAMDEHITALDSNQKQMNVRLDKIEKPT